MTHPGLPHILLRARSLEPSFWTALLTWPLMAAVQMMCPRIGMVTGQGLAGNFKQRFPRWLIRVFIGTLLAANTIDIAADLAGMADAAEMLSGINSHWFVVVFAMLISWATIRLPYHQIANVLKWLVLVLFAYPITAFVVGADCGRVPWSARLPINDCIRPAFRAGMRIAVTANSRCHV
jgi:Mn2+/Fe2+ NRAMP family transporter